MLDDHYRIFSSSDFTTFEFESVGPKGVIAKVVRYREINIKGIYNLGFGDKDLRTGRVSDLAITNKG